MDIGGEINGLQQLDAAQNGNDQPSEAVNISDVLEAVGSVDPSFSVGGGVGMMAQPPAMAPAMATVEIVEQPAPKALRFRYECEGRSAGSIPGAHSTPENKTYPTIRINNFIGTATVVVSCVTKDEPYKAHPHNLVGRERCAQGVCTIKARITEDANEYQFKNLGIQCVKRRDIAAALKARSEMRVDPFRTGFDHRNNPQSIDLNAVRLAFQVFIERGVGGTPYPLRPVVSEVIYDKKAMCDLLIVRASHCSGPVAGGTQVILLCEKVTKEEIAVVFSQKEQGRVVWEAAANIVLVHKQVAIVFETPHYNPGFYDPRHPPHQIQVEYQLKRVTDGERSAPFAFEYIPEFQVASKRKAVMPYLSAYESESHYSLEPPIKQEPNRTPPHLYSPPAQPYAEPQPQAAAAQWAGHNPFSEVPPGAGGGAGAGAWGALSPPQYGERSPLGALSPHRNLQPPLAPTRSPLAPPSPLGPVLSPGLLHHQHHHQHQHQHQQQPFYQMVQQMSPQTVQQMSPQMVQQMSPQLPPQMSPQLPPPAEQMETGASLSALLEASSAPLQHELFSLSSLVEDRENLSDSLRQLSTNDLFRQ